MIHVSEVAHSARERLDEDDFALLRGLLPAAVTDRAEALSAKILADPDESSADGIFLWHLPFDCPPLDNLFDDTRLLDVCAELLGTHDVLFSNCMLWVRPATTQLDLSFHRDYADNALVASRGSVDAIGVIVYMTEVGEASGPTRYVPKNATLDLPLYPRRIPLDAEEYARLDGHARSLTCPAGSVLIHSLLGVHRASLPREERPRITLHAVVRRANAHWMSWTSWPRLADSGRFRRAFDNLTPRTKRALGWPDESWPGWRAHDAGAIVSSRFPVASRRSTT